MAGRTDTGSNALFNENLGGKRKHVACIQDLEEVDVLTVHMIKGGIIELPVLQRHNLIGILHLHLASYLMLVLFYGASLIATIQHPLLDSSQAFQQVMYTIRDIDFAGGPV